MKWFRTILAIMVFLSLVAVSMWGEEQIAFPLEILTLLYYTAAWSMAGLIAWKVSGRPLSPGFKASFANIGSFTGGPKRD